MCGARAVMNLPGEACDELGQRGDKTACGLLQSMHKFKYSVVKSGKGCVEPCSRCGKFHEKYPFYFIAPPLYTSGIKIAREKFQISFKNYKIITSARRQKINSGGL